MRNSSPPCNTHKKFGRTGRNSISLNCEIGEALFSFWTGFSLFLNYLHPLPYRRRCDNEGHLTQLLMQSNFTTFTEKVQPNPTQNLYYIFPCRGRDFQGVQLCFGIGQSLLTLVLGLIWRTCCVASVCRSSFMPPRFVSKALAAWPCVYLSSLGMKINENSWVWVLEEPSMSPHKLLGKGWSPSDNPGASLMGRHPGSAWIRYPR